MSVEHYLQNHQLNVNVEEIEFATLSDKADRRWDDTETPNSAQYNVQNSFKSCKYFALF